MSEQRTQSDSVSQEVEYREIPGFPGYRVGNDGSAWTLHRSGTGGMAAEWRRLKVGRVNGYPRLHLRRNKRTEGTAYLHQLVLELFVGPRPGGCVARHLNGNRTDCRLSNLVWGTAVENEADKKRHGRCICGSMQISAKLRESQVAEILERLANGEKGAPLAREYGVHEGTISKIKLRKNWTHVGLAS